MIIINSADYVIPELQSEIGKIPPVFLPIGNKHLLRLQVSVLKNVFGDSETIYLSLPEQYLLSKHEVTVISELGVKLIPVSDNISLGMSLMYVLNTIGIYDETLKLLHGDTLIYDLPKGEDLVCVGDTTEDYNWKYHKNFNRSSVVWSGFFSFSSVKRFLMCLSSTQGEFIDSVLKYNDYIRLSFPVVNKWYDVGHVNTYFTTRSSITTQRAFNSLRIFNGGVWKSGNSPKKIQAEANWFQKIPSSLKRYVPQLIEEGTNEGKPYYVTEFVSCLPLNELYVYGRNTVHFWSKIFDLIFEFIHNCRNAFPSNDLLIVHDIKIGSDLLFKEKTLKRVDEFSKQMSFDINTTVLYEGVALPSLLDITNECIEKSLKLPIVNTVLHGDLCLSNIIYDSRSDNIKVVDPRGLDFNNNFSIYGNQVYDLAKLLHSIIGMYDFIIADLFELSKQEEIGWSLKFNEESRLNEIQNDLMSRTINEKITMRLVIPSVILLFISMIPLHYDKPNRQEAMLANAFRLYKLYLYS